MITADKLREWMRSDNAHPPKDLFFMHDEYKEELLYIEILQYIAKKAMRSNMRGIIFAFNNAHPEKEKLNYFKVCSIRDELIEQGFGAVITKDTKLDDPYIYLNVTWF